MNNKQKPDVYGIFGGSFDPIHIGHLILASEALSKLSLEKVIWVLTPRSPLKPDREFADLQHRKAMIEASIVDDPGFSLSTVDIDRSPPYYAADTMGILKRQMPEAKLCYLMGGDSINDLPKWYRPEVFISLCDYIGIMSRPNAAKKIQCLENLLPGIQKKIRYIDAPLIDVSATQIRARIASGEPFRYLLHPNVYEVIQKYGLYRDY
jgi:nicotinate-nucleotide adenylyltransferase